MTPTPRLPPELWESILDLAIDASINPSEQCDHLIFHYVMDDLLLKGFRGVIDPTYDNLRLVCRLFKDLLGPSPRFVMEDETQVPHRKSKSLYIGEEHIGAMWLGILVAERAKYSHIMALDIVCHTHTADDDQPASFLTLCRVARAIPNVRTLTLRLEFVWRDDDIYPLFHVWSLINNAFPRLTCLSVLVETGIPAPPGDEVATFKSLDILHISGAIPYVGFRAPSLRRLSLGRFSPEQGDLLRHFPLLQSFTFRDLVNGETVNVAFLKHLRLFGFPASMMLTPNLIGSDHCPNLSHLWIYAGTASLIPLHHVPTIIPTVRRVTFDLSSIEEYDQPALIQRLETSGSVRRGIFTMRRETHGSGLIILERTVATVPELRVNSRWPLPNRR